ncbi:hypothetical protein KCP70_02370 [Salmonella enterica subsp. enterica]|nr:hypothetical protein KCP70_02370 [Salmonella enterica subsp. enterica]
MSVKSIGPQLAARKKKRFSTGLRTGITKATSPRLKSATGYPRPSRCGCRPHALWMQASQHLNAAGRFSGPTAEESPLLIAPTAASARASGRTNPNHDIAPFHNDTLP